jgi:hypothetical protein
MAILSWHLSLESSGHGPAPRFESAAAVPRASRRMAGAAWTVKDALAAPARAGRECLPRRPVDG